MNHRPTRNGNKYKALFFTLNAPDENNTFEWCQQTSEGLKRDITLYKFLLAYQWESEIGEEGRNHLQGVIFFSQRVRWETFKNFMVGRNEEYKRIHCEPVISTKDAIKYTRKDWDKFREDPNHPVLIESFRLESIKLDTSEERSRRARKPLLDHLKSCANYAEAVVSNPDLVARCPRVCLDYYLFTAEKDPRDKVQVQWFYGTPGSGKTHSARQILNFLATKYDKDIDKYSQPYYATNTNLKWWSGYEGQRAILIDELRW